MFQLIYFDFVTTPDKSVLQIPRIGFVKDEDIVNLSKLDDTAKVCTGQGFLFERLFLDQFFLVTINFEFLARSWIFRKLYMLMNYLVTWRMIWQT